MFAVVDDDDGSIVDNVVDFSIKKKKKVEVAERKELLMCEGML
jgi:hypothetical protein